MKTLACKTPEAAQKRLDAIREGPCREAVRAREQGAARIPRALRSAHEGVRGRGGGGRRRPKFVQAGRVGLAGEGDRHFSARREDNRPVIPPSSRKYVIGATADEIWSRLRAAALAAGYGATPRFQVIGDGATWIGNGAEVNFPKQIFTVDCCHALGYVSKVCEFLARDAKEAKDVYRKARAR